MFSLTRESSLPPEVLWQRVAALASHADTVPLTETIADGGDPGVGWHFMVRTQLGPVRFDDPMVVEHWDPPHAWRVRKTGRLQGWAEARVTATDTGSSLTWQEEIWVGRGRVARLTRVIGDPLGALIFGRVADRLVEGDT